MDQHSQDTSGTEPAAESRADVDRESAASRISAYTYGNLLMLAALIPITGTDTWTRSIGILIGTAASTFAAHAFTDGVGRAVRSGNPLTHRQRCAELRNSVPILSSAAAPILVLLTVPLGWLEASSAHLVAEIVILVRISSMAFVIGHLRGQRPTRNTLYAAAAIAVVATAIVVLKVVLTQH